MKWIKRLLAAVGILFVLLILAAILIPILFKDKIEKAVKEQVNANLNATVDWGDWDLTVLSSFPNAGFEVKNVKVCNVAPFEGICLADIGELKASVGLFSLFGSRIQIRSVDLVRPIIHVKVLENGKANWDIAKPNEPTEVPAPEGETKFNIGLKSYSITDGHVIYDDATLPMVLDLGGLDHTGSGDFTQDLFTLNTKTHADSVTVVYSGVKYLRNAVADVKADLDMDLKNMKFTFKENEATVNQLVLGFDGWLAMPTNDIAMDLKWNTKKTDFGTLLSLVPAEFASNLKGVDMKGKAAFNGFVKGVYNDQHMPGFGVTVGVDNGRFKYPDLPASVDNIFVDLNITSPEGKDMDGMVVDLKRFALSMAGNPVEARMHLTTPISDPNVNAELKAKLDLASVKQVVPMKGNDLKGLFNGDVRMAGRMSDVEHQHYDKFKADGTLELKGMNYKSDSLPYGIGITDLLFQFSPQFLQLTNYDGTVGGSDLHASGRIDNYLAWWLKDSTLSGAFNVSSNTFDLNELMGPSTASNGAQAKADSTPLSVIEVPKKLDLALNAAVKQVIYDKMKLENCKGALRVHDQRVDLKDVFFNLFNGSATMSGAYDTKDIKKPTIDFAYDVKDFDIQQTVQYMETVKKMAPIAANCRGAFSTDLKMRADLDQHMMPVMQSLTGAGTLKTKSVRLEGVKVIEEINKFVKSKNLENPTLNDVSFSYEFRDGKMITKPFDVQLDRLKGRIGGSTAFADQAIDYDLTAKVPSDMFGAGATQLVSGLLGQANKAVGGNLSLPKELDMHGKITGTVTKPVFKPVFGGGGSNAKDAVVAAVKDEANKQIADAKAKAIEEAKKQRDALIAEAQKQADDMKARTRSEAANLKAQAYKTADDQLAQVKDPFAKIAAKVVADKAKQLADKKEQEALAKADAEADKIVATARQKGDDLVTKAENTKTELH